MPSVAESPHRAPFEIARAIVDPDRLVVLREGEESRLEPKVMDVLMTLVTARGEVLSRQALIERVWESEYVGDESLTRAISILRRALGDRSAIETIPRRGYRLTALVRTIEPATPGAPEEAPATAATRAVDAGTEMQRDPAGGELPEGPDSDRATPGPSPPRADREAPRHDDAGPSLSFWQELRQRSVFRVAAGYAVFGWLVIQLAETTFPHLGLPDWSVTALIVVAALGFPVAVVLAWLFELTPGGLVRDARRGGRIDRHALANAAFVVAIGAAAVLAWPGLSGILAERFDDGSTEEQATDPAREPAIAVLPFVAVSGHEEDRALAYGLAVDLLTRLSRLEALRVSSRTASFYFENKDVPLASIASQLEVTHLVEGSLRRSDDRLQVSVQLIDTRRDDSVWARTFQSERRELPDLSARLTQTVVGELEDALELEKSDEATTRGTASLDAYVAYLRGREYLHRIQGEEGLEHAEAFFRTALAHDPRYAQAWAGACEVRLVRFGRTRSDADFTEAERACYRALALDDELYEVHLALSRLFRRSGQPELALEEIEQALALNDRVADPWIERGLAHHQIGDAVTAEYSLLEARAQEPGYPKAPKALGWLYFHQGRFGEAVRAYEEVLRLRPDSASAYNDLGAVLFTMGDHGRAIAAFERSLAIEITAIALFNSASLHYTEGDYERSVERYLEASELTPEDDRVWGGLGASYRLLPGHERDALAATARAREEARRLAAIDSTRPIVAARLAVYEARLGNRNEAEEVLARVETAESGRPEVLFRAAQARAILDQPQRALDLLEAAIAAGYSPSIIVNEPDFRDLHQSARFQAFQAAKRGERA